MFKVILNALRGVLAVVTSPLWTPIYFMSVVGKDADRIIKRVNNG